MKAIVLFLLLTFLVASPALAASAVPGGAAVPAHEVPVGGARYFYCAMSQVVKYVGLFTANAPLVLGGAIFGGIACGLGW